ncbi:Poly(U)-binding-splicing factor puf60 [Nowakowskiella sp. JEL0407]|nr:Poly(U)-binding-splicing factor puf60 [Nowakowskiella sp. JEL0407]
MLSEKQQNDLLLAKQFAETVTKNILANVTPSIPTTGVASPASSLLSQQSTLQLLSRIYIGSIPFSLTEAEVKQIFSNYGYVKSMNMSIDNTTGRHKGFCFLEFDAVEPAFLAVESMAGVEVHGRQIKVGRPNNFSTNLLNAVNKPDDKVIYVGNVHAAVDEESMKSIFESFGEIEKCILIPDFITRSHKTYGYIKYASAQVAKTAADSMMGFDLAGLRLQVCLTMVGIDLGEGMKALESTPLPPSSGATAAVLSSMPQLEGIQKLINEKVMKLGIPVSAPGSNNIAFKFPNDALMANKKPKIDDALLDDEENSVLSASDRLMLMKNLAREGEVEKKSNADGTEIVLLQNMIPASELDQETKSDILQECGNYGKIVDSVWDDKQDANDVKIYLLFANVEGARNTQKVMNGRFFGGKQVVASFAEKTEYEKLKALGVA